MIVGSDFFVELQSVNERLMGLQNVLASSP
jgi:hypothetical protein